MSIQTLEPRLADVGGIPIARLLPNKGKKPIGAWCFLDHAGPADFSEDDRGMQVGRHPHTNLQTFSWMLNGEVLHKDSLGNDIKIDKINTNYMQKEALLNLQSLRANGENKALVIAATGSGKTYLAAFDVKKAKPKRVLFLVHRENILIKAKQSFESIVDSSFTCGLYTGNKKELDKKYLFATIQTMSLDFLKFERKEFEYIIVDEAHHAVSSTYLKITEFYSDAFQLGVTATPIRTDGKGLGKDAGGVFDTMVLGPTVRELIDAKYLVEPIVYASSVKPDLTGVTKTRKGDYSQKKLSKAMEKATRTTRSL